MTQIIISVEYGSDSLLTVKQSASDISYTREIYLSFDFLDITYTEIDSAILKLYAYSSSVTTSNMVAASAVAKSWLETVLRWAKVLSAIFLSMNKNLGRIQFFPMYISNNFDI